VCVCVCVYTFKNAKYILSKLIKNKTFKNRKRRQYYNVDSEMLRLSEPSVQDIQLETYRAVNNTAHVIHVRLKNINYNIIENMTTVYKCKIIK